MFENSQFTGDISNWDTYSVEDIYYMLCRSKFNGDITNWDVKINQRDPLYISKCCIVKINVLL